MTKIQKKHLIRALIIKGKRQMQTPQNQLKKAGLKVLSLLDLVIGKAMGVALIFKIYLCEQCRHFLGMIK